MQDLHKGVEIQAANGKKMLAVKVFAHALRFFKDHCLQELSDQSSTRIVNDDIRWVITVPAIWRQPAKQFMRQAAYEVSWRRYTQLIAENLLNFVFPRPAWQLPVPLVSC